MTGRLLTRSGLIADGVEIPMPPARMVHIGVGAFHRAHQAWYTSRSSDAAAWGIAGFTGQNPEVADRLSAQGGVYTLVERGAVHDKYEHIGSLVAVHPAGEVESLYASVADPAIALVTITITEAGYRLAPGGTPDLDDEVVLRDIDRLRDGSVESLAHVESPLARLVVALDRRRAQSGAPIAIVPCDNVSQNGEFVRTGMLALAAELAPPLSNWIDDAVSFVSTSVDRITPKTEPQDIESVTRHTKWVDSSPVCTEPFSSWVLAGAFPLGRPDWESAGAIIVDEIEGFERRKLWLLNGSHSLLAYAGLLRGLESVADAIKDPRCRAAVNQLWDEAERHLPAEANLAAYRRSLIERFSNPRIEHRLEQIATDGLMKLRVRIVPAVLQEFAAGRAPVGGAIAAAVWIGYLMRNGPSSDSMHDLLQSALNSSDPAAALMGLLSPDLLNHAGYMREVRQQLEGWS